MSGPAAHTSTPAVRGIVRGHVVTAVRVLRDRLAEPWTLDTLAAEVHLSRSQLVRAFDAAYGDSPTEYRCRQLSPSPTKEWVPVTEW